MFISAADLDRFAICADKKIAPLLAGRRSLACVWRSVLFLLFSGLVFG
jgi:hypothetical protein